MGVLRNPAQGKDINYQVVRTLLYALPLKGFCVCVKFIGGSLHILVTWF